jgi:hypothetical protein
MKAMRGTGWWKRPDAASGPADLAGPAWTRWRKGAGLTSGAFYAHFDSKAEAFRLVVADSLALLRNGVIAFQERHWPQLARSLHRLLSRRTHAGCPR